jgi:hypothetical protein
MDPRAGGAECPAACSGPSSRPAWSRGAWGDGPSCGGRIGPPPAGAARCGAVVHACRTRGLPGPDSFRRPVARRTRLYAGLISMSVERLPRWNTRGALGGGGSRFPDGFRWARSSAVCFHKRGAGVVRILGATPYCRSIKHLAYLHPSLEIGRRRDRRGRWIGIQREVGWGQPIADARLVSDRATGRVSRDWKTNAIGAADPP